jgi:hypothetical protein
MTSAIRKKHSLVASTIDYGIQESEILGPLMSEQQRLGKTASNALSLEERS